MNDGPELVPGWDKRITVFFAGLLILIFGWLLGIAQASTWH